MMHENSLCTSDQEWVEMKMKTPIHFNSKGNEIITWCSFGIGQVFSWATIIITCVIVVDVHYTIFVQIGLAMIMSIKVWKPFIVIRISTPHRMWWRKRCKTSFWTCVSLSKVIVVIVFWSVSWVVVHSFP
jgi:hypothetical protein